MTKMMLLALTLAVLNLSYAGADITCCDLDHNSPNVSDRKPVVGTVIGANQWTTFSASVNNNCGLQQVNINVYGYALSEHQTRATPSCPPGYFCLDYSFPSSGQNWYSVEATDNCGLKRTLGNSTFCVESCQRNLRSSAKSLLVTSSTNNAVED